MNTLVEARIWAVVLLPEFGLLVVVFGQSKAIACSLPLTS